MPGGTNTGVDVEEIGRAESSRLRSVPRTRGTTPGVPTDPDLPPPPVDPGDPPSVVNTKLRSGGTWTTIVTHPGASANTVTQANLLSSEIARVTSSVGPTVESGTQASAIRFGLASEWGLTITNDWEIGNHDSGVAYIYARNDRGLQVAVQRILHHLGYHMLTTVWEIFPTVAADVSMPLEARQLSFRVFNLGFSLQWSGVTTRLTSWTTRNALFNDGLWGYGHSYSAIKASKSADFTANPNWLAGDGSGTKFCTFESGLQADCLAYTLAQFTPTNGRKCSSLATSDGSKGWDMVCAGTGEQALYNPSDRQIKLANVVQAALTDIDPDHHVAIQAYADCSAAPTLQIDPNVFVVWATAFTQHGFSPEQVRDNYLAKGMVLNAPYSYHSEWLWDTDLPCKARASFRTELVKESERLTGGAIPPIGSTGECSSTFLPFGRYYYALAGTAVGDDAPTRWDAFPALAFPSQPALGAAWFSAIDQEVQLSSDLIHKMAQASLDLINALPTTGAECDRALDTAMWVNYVALYRAYQANNTGSTMDAMLNWCCRIRERDVTTYAAFYDLDTFATDRRAAAAIHHVSDLTKTTAPTYYTGAIPTRSELITLLTAIIAANPLIPFDIISFSDTDLVRVSGLTHASGVPGAFTGAEVKDWEYWLHSNGADFITIKAGTSQSDVGNTEMIVYEFSSGDIELDQILPPDNVSKTTGIALPALALQAQHLYKVKMINAKTGLSWSWGSGTSVVFPTTDNVSVLSGTFSGFFYVPKGTLTIGFYAQSGGSIKFFGPDNVQIGTTLAASNNFYTQDVPDGFDGCVWKITGPSNKFRFYTVPRQLWKFPSEALIPREVAVADGLTLADAVPPPTPTYPTITFDTTLTKPNRVLTGSGGSGFYNYVSVDGSFYAMGTGVDIGFTMKAGIASALKGNSTVTVVNTNTSTTVDTWSSAPDKIIRPFTFHGDAGVLYRLDVDANGGVNIDWDFGAPVVISTPGRSLPSGMFTASFGGWVYVPKGTAHVEFWADGGSIKWYDDKAKLITTISAGGGFYSFPVPAGKDGTCMRFSGATKRIGMNNIPPWWAMEPSGLLVPLQVYLADGL
jgi:hypothetical protein